MGRGCCHFFTPASCCVKLAWLSTDSYPQMTKTDTAATQNSFAWTKTEINSDTKSNYRWKWDCFSGHSVIGFCVMLCRRKCHSDASVPLLWGPHTATGKLLGTFQCKNLQQTLSEWRGPQSDRDILNCLTRLNKTGITAESSHCLMFSPSAVGSNLSHQLQLLCGS